MNHVKDVIAKKKELGKKEPTILWQFLTMKHNEHEISKARKIAKELDIGLDIRPMRMNTAIDVEVKQDNVTLKTKWLPSFKKLRRKIYKEKKRKRVGPKSCLFLWNQAVINWNGIVTPCCAIFDYNKHKFGDIHEKGGLMKAWNNETYQTARKMVKHMDPEFSKDKKFDMCAGCIKNEFVDV